MFNNGIRALKLHMIVILNKTVYINNVALAGHVNIGEYAIIGGLSAVHQFVSIGKHAMVSGEAYIKDVPPYVKAN